MWFMDDSLAVFANSEAAFSASDIHGYRGLCTAASKLFLYSAPKGCHVSIPSVRWLSSAKLCLTLQSYSLKPVGVANLRVL